MQDTENSQNPGGRDEKKQIGRGHLGRPSHSEALKRNNGASSF